MPVQGVGPSLTYHRAFLFYVAFVIPMPNSQQAQSLVYVNPAPIHGAEISAGAGVFDVLLGMDIISTGSLKVEGNGQFSFCF